MTELSITTPKLAKILKEMANDLKEHAEELRQLDAKVGDGDLGITINLMVDAITEYVSTANGDDIGRYLAQCGLSINRANPSTFGTIVATAFIGAGKTVTGKTKIEAGDLAMLGEGAIANIQKRGKAQVGDKTVLDALVPAVSALKNSLTDGASVPAAIQSAVNAAEEGMKATADMKAMVGRAKMFGEKSIGVQDGGATAAYYMMESFARHLLASSE